MTVGTASAAHTVRMAMRVGSSVVAGYRQLAAPSPDDAARFIRATRTA